MAEQLSSAQLDGPLMSVKEVAEYLRISTRSVSRAVSTGVLPAPVRIGKRSPRWPRAVLVEHINTLAKMGARRL